MAQQTIDRQAVADRPPRLTFEEFVRWVPDGAQAEWVDGEAIVLTTNARHVRLSRLLTNLLSTFVAMFNLGEVFPAPFLMRASAGGPGRGPGLIVPLPPHLARVKLLELKDRPISRSSSFPPRPSRPTGSGNTTNTKRPVSRSTSSSTPARDSTGSPPTCWTTTAGTGRCRRTPAAGTTRRSCRDLGSTRVGSSDSRFPTPEIGCSRSLRTPTKRGSQPSDDGAPNPNRLGNDRLGQSHHAREATRGTRSARATSMG